ncbi:YHYH protein [Yoonia maricola]|uniref:YHYH protein n=1 Tax=Yoonia maricola TaxID=420999 RepID=A0A2M8W498_9RHOB|nr:YHYH protein [Yoonia maricola]PJI85739.1 YHYH protein [Yoonia maricola]
MIQLKVSAFLLVACATALPTQSVAHPDLDSFAQTAFAAEPQTVDCVLEDGTATSCYEFTVGYLPEGLETGPFCPATLDDAGGIWDWDGDDPGLYRIDETFLRMLDDQGYTFFDADGTVHVVDIATEQPAVDHACINVSQEETVTITMQLPITPAMAEAPTVLGTVGKVGVALDGAPIFSDAPSVLQTGHMPALDTCGGHIDPGGWFHWHATATDIETVFETEGVSADCALTQDSAGHFGYAFDGFAMYGSTELDGTIPTDLDACNGHVGETSDGEVYHYHASTAFPNLPPCLVGVQAQDNFVTTASAGIGAQNAADGGRHEPPRPGEIGQVRVPPGFDEAAAELGVTTETLMEALQNPAGGRPDLAIAAERLGVTMEELQAILPPPPPRQ